MFERGIIIGSDQHQECFLPWWWENYSLHNSYPVVFVDFGMSSSALDWCKNKGQCVALSKQALSCQDEVSPGLQKIWEEIYGVGIWRSRQAWFKKPLALLQSPFSLGLWIDLDCKVNGALDPIFNALVLGVDIALVREAECIQEKGRKRGTSLQKEVNYNSGVIAFRQNAEIIHHWLKEVTGKGHEYPGDQSALNRAIYLHKPSLFELPSSFNWIRNQGANSKAIIEHFIDGKGKIDIWKEIKPELADQIDLLHKMALEQVRKG